MLRFPKSWNPIRNTPQPVNPPNVLDLRASQYIEPDISNDLIN
jgi:hypothetical protein